MSGEAKLVRLNINLPKNLKNNFLKTAKQNETDASKLIRKYIKEYLKQNKQKD